MVVAPVAPVAPEEHKTFSLPLESVVSAETLSEPEQLIEVPNVNPRTPLGNVTLKLDPSYPNVPPLTLLKYALSLKVGIVEVHAIVNFELE